LLYFFHWSSKAMYYSCRKPIPILSNKVVEVITCISVVKVHWKFIFLRQIKMKWKYSQLLFLTRVVKSVIIQSTLSNRNKFILNPKCLLLQNCKIMLKRSVFLTKWLSSPTGMHSNSTVGIRIFLTKLIGMFSIFKTSSSYK
jgi:hypothetical protein